MNTISSILVVVDPTVVRDFVVDRAKLIAKASDATVRFFINNADTLREHSYLYEGMNGEIFETQCKLHAEHINKILANLVDEFDRENIAASYTYTAEHHLAEAIIKQVVELKPDLVLKSTHHHSIIKRTLVTNTDWRLIRKCPAALFLVKPEPWREGGSVVTAVDPLHSKADQSELDHYLIDSAELLARQLDQTACVFHSYFPFTSTMFSLGVETPEHLARIRQQHSEKLNELLADHAIAADNIQLSHGELVPTLIKYLKLVNANVLVIGALSRNVLERAIVGNTAERILEDCPCDVLVLNRSSASNRGSCSVES